MPGIVLQKFIADSGFCSRRQAEVLIKAGKVELNGEKARLGLRVGENDVVKINGKKIGLAKERIYIKLNKPAGYVCTNAGFRGEKSVFDLVNLKTRMFVVGRLDKESRGLVLLTNDGELAQKLTHPSFQHEKIYELRVSGHLGRVNEVVKNIKAGVNIGEGDGVVKPKNVKYLDADRFSLVLTEGKKRQIRRMFEAVGCEVTDLLRTEISGLTLWKLGEGEWKFLTKEEINKLNE